MRPNTGTVRTNASRAAYNAARIGCGLCTAGLHVLCGRRGTPCSAISAALPHVLKSLVH